MAGSSKSGHRQRLRDRFLSNEERAHTDEALLELLLTYSIPLKDIQPLANSLISQFGSLSGVLEADPGDLCKIKGIKETSAVLLKAIDYVRRNSLDRRQEDKSPTTTQTDEKKTKDDLQPSLFASDGPEDQEISNGGSSRAKKKPKLIKRYGTELFGKAVLKEAIEVLPGIPDTESIDEIRNYLRENLPFSSAGTRDRYASYVIRRMFPEGYVDDALRLFAKHFARKTELKEVCYYRFMKAEPLMQKVTDDLVIPSLGKGKISRSRLRDYLQSKYPESKSIYDCAQAIAEAFKSGGIGTIDNRDLFFRYRDVTLSALAFIIHSEFPDPGIYDLAKLESNKAIMSMLWTPSQILPALYELRNLSLISKVSEIDYARQFTTRFTLDEIVEKMTEAGDRQ